MKPLPPPRLLHLAWPMMAELVLGFSVGMLGLALAAQGSDHAAAAFGVANHVQTTFFLLFRIVSMGVSVVVTQNLGAGDRATANRYARDGLSASTWLGLGVALTLVLGAGRLLIWLNTPEVVATLAQPYLQTLALALLLDAWNANLAAVLRAHLRTRAVMLVILLIHAAHLALCVPLMRGWGPLPGFGLPGFALALVLSRVLGLGLLFHLWRTMLALRVQWSDWWHLRVRDLGPVLHIGLPGAAENVAYRIAMLVSVSVVAGLGSKALATQSYTFQVMNMVVLYSLSLGLAGELLIGHFVGAGSLRRTHRVLRRSLAWGLVGSTALAMLVALSAPWTLRWFTQDADILSQATTLLWLAVLLEPGRTCNIIVINALRATGDARFPVAVGSVSMVVVMAGGTWLLGVHFGLGLTGVWLAYIADEWVRGLTMVARWFGYGWLGHARIARRRARLTRIASAQS